MVDPKNKKQRPRKVENKEQTVAFSFKYLKEHGKHSIFKMPLRGTQAVEVYQELLRRLKEISSIRADELSLLGREKGREKIPVMQLAEGTRESLLNLEFVGNDSTITVFRFYRNNYRILCVEDKAQAQLFYIVMFDFDFTAYDHGR